tara:strand:+ start:564 stop:668 length:105 start_codon:yes stop_codon:yes gene_type:complete
MKGGKNNKGKRLTPHKEDIRERNYPETLPNGIIQ